LADKRPPASGARRCSISISIFVRSRPLTSRISTALVSRRPISSRAAAFSNTGFAKAFESILKAYPKTTFIGHADAFWANVSADYHNEAVYPTGLVTPGGVTDRWLGDYESVRRHVRGFRPHGDDARSGVRG